MILVLDSFPGSVFQEIIDSAPEYKNIFDGFVYYKNALAGYPATYASVPLILTGKYYDNSIPIQQFIQKAFSGNSLPKVLLDNGFQVDLVGGGKSIYADQHIATNWLDSTSLLHHHVARSEAAFLVDMTLFRHLPHFLKPYIYNEQTWLLSRVLQSKAVNGFPPGTTRDDIEFVKNLQRSASNTNPHMTFKYFHLMLSHPPIRNNEKLEYVKEEFTHQHFVEQEKGALRLAEMLIQSMKKIGVFDNSMIFIISDHGLASEFQQRTYGARDDRSELPMMDRIKVHACPLFLVKPFFSTGKMKTSLAPVSHADIAKTIFTELGVNADVQGVPIARIPESEKRVQRFLDHQWGFQKYLPAMTEYEVSGPPLLSSSWRRTGRVFTAQGVQTAAEDRYAFGAKITFGQDGTYAKYCGVGWTTADNDYTWTNGKSATLSVPIEKTTSNLLLQALIHPFTVPGKLESQRVNIFANGVNVGTWIAKDKIEIGDGIRRQGPYQEQVVVIPNRFLKDPILTLTFELPDATSQETLGSGSDSHTYGLAFKLVILREI